MRVRVRVREGALDIQRVHTHTHTLTHLRAGRNEDVAVVAPRGVRDEHFAAGQELDDEVSAWRGTCVTEGVWEYERGCDKL